MAERAFRIRNLAEPGQLRRQRTTEAAARAAADQRTCVTLGNHKQKSRIKAKTINITMLSRTGKGRRGCTLDLSADPGTPGSDRSRPNTTPSPTVTTAPMAFHQNQNTFGQNNHRNTFTATPVAAATLAATGVTRGRTVSRKMPRMGP